MKANANLFWLFSIVAIVFLAGCENKKDSSPSKGSSPEPLVNNMTSMGVDDSPVRSPKPPAPPPSTSQTGSQSGSQTNLPPPPPPADATAANAQPGSAQAGKVADVGAGSKGRGYGLGFIATPAASLFAARERIIFQDQIPHQMDMFKALNNRPPKSHEEFMEEIVKPLQITLPELPEGQKYQYNPKDQQLWVLPDNDKTSKK